jgi:hypothetical protein
MATADDSPSAKELLSRGPEPRPGPPGAAQDGAVSSRASRGAGAEPRRHLRGANAGAGLAGAVAGGGTGDAVFPPRGPLSTLPASDVSVVRRGEEGPDTLLEPRQRPVPQPYRSPRDQARRDRTSAVSALSGPSLCHPLPGDRGGGPGAEPWPGSPSTFPPFGMVDGQPSGSYPPFQNPPPELRGPQAWGHHGSLDSRVPCESPLVFRSLEGPPAVLRGSSSGFPDPGTVLEARVATVSTPAPAWGPGCTSGSSLNAAGGGGSHQLQPNGQMRAEAPDGRSRGSILGGDMEGSGGVGRILLSSAWQAPEVNTTEAARSPADGAEVSSQDQVPPAAKGFFDRTFSPVPSCAPNDLRAGSDVDQTNAGFPCPPATELLQKGNAHPCGTHMDSAGCSSQVDPPYAGFNKNSPGCVLCQSLGLNHGHEPEDTRLCQSPHLPHDEGSWLLQSGHQVANYNVDGARSRAQFGGNPWPTELAGSPIRDSAIQMVRMKQRETSQGDDCGPVALRETAQGANNIQELIKEIERRQEEARQVLAQCLSLTT